MDRTSTPLTFHIQKGEAGVFLSLNCELNSGMLCVENVEDVISLLLTNDGVDVVHIPGIDQNILRGERGLEAQLKVLHVDFRKDGRQR